MFKKSILQLHLKDKLFFLLVAILAIAGIYFGAKTAISYLSNPIKDHRKGLDQTKNQLAKLEEKYGDKLNVALHQVTTTCEKLKKGLIGQLNENVTKEKLDEWQEKFGKWTYIGVGAGAFVLFVNALVCIKYLFGFGKYFVNLF